MKTLLAKIKHWFGVHTYKATLRHPLKWQKAPTVDVIDVAYADPSSIEPVMKCVVCGKHDSKITCSVYRASRYEEIREPSDEV